MEPTEYPSPSSATADSSSAPPLARPMISSTLPLEVITCLSNARFLHLATCHDQEPHVSLMNYTYLPRTPWRSHPTIIMTTPPASKKTQNLLVNPRVSLLVHDWVSHRPPTLTSSPTRARVGSEGRPADSRVDDGRNGDVDRDGGARRDGQVDGQADRHSVARADPLPLHSSSLATLLATLNTSALSSISATIVGTATLVPTGTDEERWCKAQHLANNTFGEQAREERGILGAAGDRQAQDGAGADDGGTGDGGRVCFIEGEEVRVVLVKICRGRIADWKGGVKDWVIEGSDAAGETEGAGGHGSPVVNGR